RNNDRRAWAALPLFMWPSDDLFRAPVTTIRLVSTALWVSLRDSARVCAVFPQQLEPIVGRRPGEPAAHKSDSYLQPNRGLTRSRDALRPRLAYKSGGADLQRRGVLAPAQHRKHAVFSVVSLSHWVRSP